MAAISPHVSFLDGKVHSSFYDTGTGRRPSTRRDVEASPLIFDGDEKFQASPGKDYAQIDTNLSDEAELAKKKPRHIVISFIIVYTMIFFNGCCFTAVVPSVPFYLQVLHAPKEFLGWVVSFYSLGQIVGSPTGGWLSNKMPAKQILTISSTIGLFSSLLYAIAPGYYYVLFSRLFTGVSAGMEFTTELTFIAHHTNMTERTAFLATITAVNISGFIMGPALGAALALIDIEIFGYSINEYTGPGWLLVIMFAVDIFMVRVIFKENLPGEENTTEEGAEESEESKLVDNKESDQSYGGVKAEIENETSEETNDEEIEEPPPSLPLVLSLIFIQFSLMIGFSLLETIASPLVHDHFGWSVNDCNLLFTCGGVVSLFVYFAFVTLSKRVADRILVFTALAVCFVGFVFAIDWKHLSFVPNWMSAPLPPYMTLFLIGFGMMYGGFMIGRSITFALYSKLIASQYQGKYLGWMVAGGSAARTSGPFLAVYLYYTMNTDGARSVAVFGPAAVLHLICLVLMLVHWTELLPGGVGLTPVSGKKESSMKKRFQKMFRSRKSDNE